MAKIIKYNDYFIMKENNNNKLGFTFEKDFDIDDEDIIIDNVMNNIADMVNDGFISGQFSSDKEPSYSTSWYLTVDDNDSDDSIYYHEVSKSIRNNNYQGFNPNYKLYITIK